MPRSAQPKVARPMKRKGKNKNADETPALLNVIKQNAGPRTGVREIS